MLSSIVGTTENHAVFHNLSINSQLKEDITDRKQLTLSSYSRSILLDKVIEASWIAFFVCLLPEANELVDVLFHLFASIMLQPAQMLFFD
jgi:hypothetical protein